MLGSQKQISWALAIQNKTLHLISNDCPLQNQIIEFYKNLENASWWINNRNDLISRRFIMVYGLVNLAQEGYAEACSVIIKIQNQPSLSAIFNRFKVINEEV